MATPGNKAALAVSAIATLQHMSLSGTFTHVSSEDLDAAPEPKGVWDLRKSEEVFATINNLAEREKQM